MSSQVPFQQNASDPAAQPLAEAVKHHQAGRMAEAERLYRVVIGLAPRHGDALRLLGVLHLQNGKPEQALPLLQDASQAQPKNPEILNHLGVALSDTGRGKDALASFRQALVINPGYASALGNLGKAFLEQGDAKAALDCFEKLVQHYPNDPKIHVNMGRCWYEMSNFQQAFLCFEKALSQKPDSVDALGGEAAALWAMGHLDETRMKLEYALRIEPDNIDVMTNLGELLHAEGKISEALEQYNRVLSRVPEFPTALWRKGFALLTMGEYREGWKMYAESLGHRDLRGLNLFAPAEPWGGAPAPNKHLLIWGEQGLGDVIQFIRYAELCKERVGKVSVFCAQPLVRLFKALPFIDDAFDTIRDRSAFDEHVPVMNLPHLFDTTLETVPAAVPYLRVGPEIQMKWKTRFANDTGMKVGLVWAGGSHQDKVQSALTDRQRSIGLERMKPWFDLHGVQFYSLQKNEPAAQIAALGLAGRIIDVMGEAEDFADTAAIVQNLDLVIAVDTSVAHLAGGLGKPVWILSRYNACWRWLQNRPSSPWYPTARIFGQPALGDWDSVIAEVGRELELEIVRRSPNL